jgi:hypothetical protein
MFAFGATVAGPVLTIETSAELAAGVTVMLQLLLTVTGVESVALAVKEKGLPTAVVGVPVTAPEAVFRLKPGGSDPGVIENVYGDAPPVGASKELYAAPTRAAFSGQETAVSVGGVPVVIGNPGLTTVLVSKVTAPICAKALPFSVAPVVSVTDA